MTDVFMWVIFKRRGGFVAKRYKMDSPKAGTYIAEHEPVEVLPTVTLRSARMYVPQDQGWTCSARVDGDHEDLLEMWLPPQ